MTLLSVKNLYFSYNKQEVLHNIDFTIQKGDFIALLGANGSGKTTLIKIILGLLPLQKGNISLFDTNLESFNSWQKIGYLEQKNTLPSLIPLTAFDVVRLGLISTKKGVKIFNKQDNEKTKKIMQKFACYSYKDKLFNELSGGQQQRVLFARALVKEPEFLILDEPSTALDSSSRKDFISLISSLNKEKQLTILLITHDISQAGEFANKLLILDKKIIFYGNKQDFCSSSKVTSYFGPYTQHIIDHLHSQETCPLPCFHNHQNCEDSK